ncbi:golgin subfamily A member 4-like isoform X2 [Sparus aurata]|uniref:golgin subfamily A member 4-like isoform X2 n=1 Tax=Sparus aurata TaxID=8175 RepID=UPI0011C1C081|nr:golgin subfamily A member 4-like isoform X2 [Sparus aurata]
MKSLNKDPHRPGDVGQLKEEFVSLTDERHTLTSNNKDLSSKVEQLQQQRDTCDDVYLAVRVEGDTKREQDDQVKADSYITLSQSGPEPTEEPDSSSVQEKVPEINILKVQLRQAEDTAHKVQSECAGLKGELVDLQQLYDSSQQERVALEQELQRCKAELQKLMGRKSQQSGAEGWNLAVAAVAVAAIVVLVVPSFTRA